MILPLHISFRNMAASPAIEAMINERAGRLEQFAGDIMRCQVTVELVGKHQHQGRLHAVRIELTVARAEIVITHGHQSEDVAIALRGAFDAATRKLEDYVRRRRGDVKTHAPDGGRSPS